LRNHPHPFKRRNTTVLSNIVTTPASPYGSGLEKNAANFAALSPLSFLAKAAAVYPHRIALIHGERRISWAETYARCRRLASALRQRGVKARFLLRRIHSIRHCSSATA
jgi:fatty-acyl-CoA synthase